MESLFERAEEMAQEKYRQTFDYATRNIGVAFRNVLRENKLPEPQYKETKLNENYLQEMISYMEIIHQKDLKEVAE
ncbi:MULTISPECIES: hypothetical protein [unclassified Enterococcus]|uniref:hypothetical protein n=1 Tax=unclassified Enterococcus TaxID=2608891 RepID=UPI000A34C465|nr:MULTISPECIES: hypothetical protein [unclassified Enterococcus]OTO71300.1 hypothetical protein A5865_002996 [Enterococcus sp. 12E11_DIV0728]OUZ15324.1 hypothetical protein A5868_000232 [Enterococcus sp. 12F9_DIV0723]